MAENALSNFLGYGTEMVTWLVTNVLNMITSFMGNPVTACFLIISLVSLVFVTYKTVTHR